MVLLSWCWVISKGCPSLTRNIKRSIVLVQIWSLWFLRFCLYQLFEVFTVVADWATCFHKSNQSWGYIGKSPYSYQHCKSTVLGKNLVYRENMTKYRCSWRHHDHHDTTISVHPYPQSNSSLRLKAYFYATVSLKLPSRNEQQLRKMNIMFPVLLNSQSPTMLGQHINGCPSKFLCKFCPWACSKWSKNRSSLIWTRLTPLLGI